MSVYFVHNGYCGWAYGTPSDPQLVSPEDAAKIMRLANLTPAQVAEFIPPAQYANQGEALYELTAHNRFLCFGEIGDCADISAQKTSAPLQIRWPAT